MPTIKLTSKRQATLPKRLCDELKVGPGDELDVDTRIVDGETVWVLKPRSVDWSWVGALPVSPKASHSLEQIRASISRGRKKRRP